MLLSNRTFNLFDELFNDSFFGNVFKETSYSQVMKTDVQEVDGNYIVDIELPGYAKEDVMAELQDGYLTITASKNENKDEQDNKGNYIRRERYQGTCKRSFYIGENINQEDIKAGFQDGILRLAIPKEAMKIKEEQPKLITIE